MGLALAISQAALGQSPTDDDSLVMDNGSPSLSTTGTLTVSVKSRVVTVINPPDPPPPASLFVNSWSITPEGQVWLRHTADPVFYYILYRGTEADRIFSAVDIALGVPVEGQLSDHLAGATRSFYRLRQVPLSDPLDTDDDGIDDVWEIQNRQSKAALNHHDAMEDQNRDGMPDLNEYRLLSQSVTASFVTAASHHLTGELTIEVPVQFSKPFRGTMSYHITGDALLGRDYVAGPSQITVDGTTGFIPVILLDPLGIEGPRSLQISLTQDASSSYGLKSPSSHLLTLHEGDCGVYAGSLMFTNGMRLGPQALHLAVRSVSGQVGRARVQPSDATFFHDPFEFDVQFTNGAGHFVAPQPAQGRYFSPSLGRELTWSLEINTPVFTEVGMTAGVHLTVHGLAAATDYQARASGTLVLGVLDPALK